MSGRYPTGRKWPSTESLGTQLRRLRDQAGSPGWEVAAAARMDSGLLSKIETGKRLPTQVQLAAIARFFKVDPVPLEARRIAEDARRRYGTGPALDAATAILREEPPEYRVNKLSAAASKQARLARKPSTPVNKPKKSK